MTIKPSHIAAAKLKVATAAKTGESVPDWIRELATRSLTDTIPSQESLSIPAFRTDADAGNTNAMVNLGLLYMEQGEPNQAKEWYRKAADAGNTNAMDHLGLLHVEQGEPDQAFLL